MILASDIDLPGCQILNGVIRTVVPKLHFHCLRTRCQPQQLVAEANAEYRHIVGDHLLDGVDRVVAWLWITRTVRQEHAVRPEGKRIASRCLRRDHRHPAAAIGKHAQDVVFNTKVVRDNVKLRRRPRLETFAERPGTHVPFVFGFTTNDLCEVKTDHLRCGLRQFLRALDCCGIDRTDDDAAVLRALFAGVSRQAASIDISNRNDVIANQIVNERFLAAKIRGEQRQIANDQSGCVGVVRFRIFAIGTDVTNMGVSQRDDLPHI